MKDYHLIVISIISRTWGIKMQTPENPHLAVNVTIHCLPTTTISTNQTTHGH